jgi:hypothetical protein
MLQIRLVLSETFNHEQCGSMMNGCDGGMVMMVAGNARTRRFYHDDDYDDVFVLAFLG